VTLPVRAYFFGTVSGTVQEEERTTGIEPATLSLGS
jgi:hypothetical protein